MRVRSDEAQPAPGFRNIDIARRTTRGRFISGERPALLQPRTHHVQREILIEALFLDIAQRHDLNQGHIVALRVRPCDQVGEFVSVCALQRHRVDLDLEPRFLRRSNPVQHLRQGIAA